MAVVLNDLKQGIALNPFREGETYTRKSVYSICYPGQSWERGGPWASGFDNVRQDTPDKKLIIFMSIGISGRTGHDYNNSYNSEIQEIIWCGDSGSHSNQPTFANLIQGISVPHFFARWDDKPQFKYLGIGLLKSFEENFFSSAGLVLRLKFKCLKRNLNKNSS